jgi:hypothetical protein
MTEPGDRVRRRRLMRSAAKQHLQDRHVIDHLVRKLTGPRCDGVDDRCARPRRFGARRGRALQDALWKMLNRAAGGLPEF